MKVKPRLISKRKNFKWNLIFGYINILLAMGVGIFMVPLYLQYIPSDLYGAWLASGNLLIWLMAIDPGISTLMMQKIANYLGQKDMEKVSSTISSGFFISITISVLIGLIGFFFAEEAIAFLKLGEGMKISVIIKAFVIASFSSAVVLLTNSLAAIIHALHASQYVGVATAISYVVAVVSVLVLLENGFGILAIPYSYLVRACVLFLLEFFFIIKRYIDKELFFRFEVTDLRDLLGLSLYTFMGRMGGIITSNSESFIIARYFGADVVTPIALSKKIPFLSISLVQTIASAFFPSISLMRGGGGQKILQNVLMRLYFFFVWIVGFLVCYFVIFNESIISLWVGIKFYSGNHINLIICFSLLITLIAGFFTEIISSFGEFKKIGVATIVQSILFVPFTWCAIHFFGLAGVLIGPAVSMGVVTGLYSLYLFFKKPEFSRTQIKKMKHEFLIVFIATISLYFIFYAINAQTIPSLTMKSFYFLFSYCFIILILSKNSKKELLYLFKKIKK